MGVDGIEADSKNDSIALGIFRLVHLKLVGFFRSTRGLIFGIEVEDDPFAAKVFEADGSAVLRGEGEVGGGGASRGRGVPGGESGNENDECRGDDEREDQEAEHELSV